MPHIYIQSAIFVTIKHFILYFRYSKVYFIQVYRPKHTYITTIYKKIKTQILFNYVNTRRLQVNS